jgi:hypothetical protein
LKGVVADAISFIGRNPAITASHARILVAAMCSYRTERTSGIEAGCSYRESYGESVRRTNATPVKIAALIYDRKTLSTAQTTS